jgi:kynurenine formamidase
MGRIDEIGALHRITEDTVLSSLAYVKKGRVLSLGQVYDEKMPLVWFHGSFSQVTFRTVEETLKMFEKDFTNKLGSVICRYELSDHTGTHVDSLNHATIGYEFYGGADARKISADKGTTKLGIETMPPVFARGILLDFASFLGVDMLEPSFEIKQELVEQLIRKERIEIKVGDAVLFYTGYCKLWGRDNPRYLDLCPGPGKETAKWLARKRIGITGSDTVSYEVVKPKTKELFPCHQILIKKNGIHLVENLKLDALAKENVVEFLFVLSPLKLKGGAGSPVAPLAVY